MHTKQQVVPLLTCDSWLCMQTPDLGRDQEIVNAAKNIMFNSAQKFRLTELSGRRDMSLLLAQSAVQVCTPSHGCGTDCLHCAIT